MYITGLKIPVRFGAKTIKKANGVVDAVKAVEINRKTNEIRLELLAKCE
jgi:hypothetical protein